MDTQSQSISELAKALVKFQGELKPVKREHENPFFKAKYADLAAIWDAIREPLSKNGLAVVQANHPNDGGVILETMLIHISGEWIKSIVKMHPNKNDPQSFGSCQTYARRYGLSAMLGIATEDDDDANAASASPKEKGGNREEPNHYWTFESKKQKGKYGIGAIPGDILTPESLEALGMREYKGRFYGDYSDELENSINTLGGIFNDWHKR